MRLGHLLRNYSFAGLCTPFEGFTSSLASHGILHLFPQPFALLLHVHSALYLPKQSYFCSIDNGFVATYSALESTLPAPFVY